MCNKQICACQCIWSLLTNAFFFLSLCDLLIKTTLEYSCKQLGQYSFLCFIVQQLVLHDNCFSIFYPQIRKVICKIPLFALIPSFLCHAFIMHATIAKVMEQVGTTVSVFGLKINKTVKKITFS